MKKRRRRTRRGAPVRFTQGKVRIVLFALLNMINTPGASTTTHREMEMTDYTYYKGVCV